MLKHFRDDGNYSDGSIVINAIKITRLVFD